MAPRGQVNEGRAASCCLLGKRETGTFPKEDALSLDKVRDEAAVGTPQRPLQATLEQGIKTLNGLKTSGNSQLLSLLFILHMLPMGPRGLHRVFCMTPALPEAQPAKTRLGCPLRAKT